MKNSDQSREFRIIPQWRQGTKPCIRRSVGLDDCPNKPLVEIGHDNPIECCDTDHCKRIATMAFEGRVLLGF